MRTAFKNSLLLLATMILFASCSSYGEKIEINDKSEVYIKDGGKKEDAKRLGEFLLNMNYFDNKSPKSIQLTKGKDTFIVKFIVDSQKVDNEIEIGFQYMGMMLQDSVFAGKPTMILLTDKDFKPFKTIETLSHQDVIDIQSANNDTLPPSTIDSGN